MKRISKALVSGAVLVISGTASAADYPAPVPLKEGAQADVSKLKPAKDVTIAYMPPATEFNYYIAIGEGIKAEAAKNGIKTFMLAPQSGADINGQMGMIEWNGLRFTPGETRGLFGAIRKKSLSPGLIGQLHDRTEGWAAAIYLATLGDETTIDDNYSAGDEASRRQNPIAGSRHIAAQGRPTSVDKRLGSRKERGGEFNMTELMVSGIKPSPSFARREFGRWRRKTLLKCFDQRFLPGLALDLPRAEPDERYERRDREQGRDCKTASDAPCRRGLHDASPPWKRPSSALLWYCNAIRRPLTGRNGNTAVIRMSGPHSSA